MCGIVGYVGNNAVTDILLSGLKNLEYRGYDSAGIALNDNERFQVIKAEGKLHNLYDKVNGSTLPLNSRTGIGHIRWATHGEANIENAHPHISDNGKLVLVHNGIIENYKELRETLTAQGYIFVSETDTEAAAHLIASEYQSVKNLEQAVLSALPKLNGAYAFCIMHKDYPEEIIAVRKNAPLLIGLGEGENFVASDIPALIGKASHLICLDDYEMAVVRKDSVTVKNLSGEIINKKIEPIAFEEQAISKHGFKHFMLKEINEQSDILRHNLKKYLNNGKISFPDLDLQKIAQTTENIEIVACGTSLHAAQIAATVMQKWLNVPVTTEAASEYIYNKNLTSKKTLVLGLSQSGETADTLSALKLARETGAMTLAITNRPDSSISRIVDGVISINAGIEVSVAATKSYTAQLIVLYLLGLGLAPYKNQTFNDQTLLSELETLPTKIEQILSNTAEIQACATRFAHASNVFYIARGINNATAREGALKLKEISYINANAYLAGELKHGPIALLDEQTPVLAILNPHSPTFAKIVSNCEEAKARKAPLIGITSENKESFKNLFDFILQIPDCCEDFSPFLAVIPLQLLAYYIADRLGREIDQPRNLAKSVTVE